MGKAVVLCSKISVERRLKANVFDRIGVTAPDERAKLFKGVVDNGILTEARALRVSMAR